MAFISVLVTAIVVSSYYEKILITESGEVQFSFAANSVHTRIRMWQDQPDGSLKLVFDEYHAGNVTHLGLNTTFAKLTGNFTDYNATVYMQNITQMGIGNQGTLDYDSTILPAEWNRTTCSQHDGEYYRVNFTAVFYPDAGPYTADCMGAYYGSGNTLFCYDTFTEVSGIDDSFTITFEMILSATGT